MCIPSHLKGKIFINMNVSEGIMQHILGTVLLPCCSGHSKLFDESTMTTLSCTTKCGYCHLLIQCSNLHTRGQKLNTSLNSHS